MFKVLIPVLVILASFHQTTKAFGVGSISGNLRKYIELGQALKYGDNCSWEAEEYRQNFTTTRLLGGGIPTMQTVMELADTIVERDYKLCSAAELFICDKTSQKCVCGDPGYESLLGVNRALYTLEGTNKCRWNTGTYCVPDDSFASQRQLGVVVDSKCKLGTTCKLGSGDSCSLQAVIRHILRNHGFAAITNPRRITQEMMSGNVCACKSDQVNDNSIGNEISGDSPSAARRKRSVSEIKASMFAVYAAGPTIVI